MSLAEVSRMNMVTFRGFSFFIKVHAPLLERDDSGRSSWVQEAWRLTVRSCFWLLIQNSANINIQSSVAGLAKATDLVHEWDPSLVSAIVLSFLSSLSNLWTQSSRMYRLLTGFYNHATPTSNDRVRTQWRYMMCAAVCFCIVVL